MNNNTPLQIGEKIRQIRVAKGLSQDNLAYATGKSKAHISRLERGDSEIDGKTLAAIKEFLEIPGAPLLEHELEVFRLRIWGWNELVSARRIENAIAQQKELSQILNLPFEHDLIIIYKMISARMAFLEPDHHAVEEHLSSVEGMLDNASEGALYLYHRVKGTLMTHTGNIKTSLRHHLQALEHSDNILKPDLLLVSSVGTLYIVCGAPVMAMTYFERFIREYKGDESQLTMNAAHNDLGACYTVLGYYEKARKLFQSCLVRARSYGNQKEIGTLLANLGLISSKTGDYEAGIKFVDEALPYLQLSETRRTHLNALIIKAHCLAKINKRKRCEEIIAQCRDLTKKEEYKEFTVMVETYRYIFIAPNDDQAIEYLESVSLPYYMNSGLLHATTVLEICDTLEALYLKRGAVRKADAIVRISRDVYKGIVCGPGDLEL